MVYVSRDATGKISGVFANPQPGWAEEAISETDASVVSFLAPSVQSVSPRQARLALLSAGLLDQVQSAVTAAGGATEITWEYATEFQRNDPMILSIASSLNLTSDTIDNLFKQAATL